LRLVTAGSCEHLATYHNEDRLHDSLNKDAPNRRRVEHKPSPVATVTSCCRLGGLHHRYGWSVAA
jgi:hypothetical protein